MAWCRVPNPSALFLAARAAGTSGSAVTALMEGSRPMLVEVQALAARSGFGTPQRVATGLDQKRLAVLLAVLERRGGTSFADLDVFVRVTAGVRLTEPASDLAVAAALLFECPQPPSPPDALFLGGAGAGWGDPTGRGDRTTPGGGQPAGLSAGVRLRPHNRAIGGTHFFVGLDHVRPAGASACRVTSEW